ncbi:RPL6 [Cordylochernes scorpioides]|uniref:Large ribosomal subunit protein eL6 n=1 Tax=Cordylochernes scorpioides TaxID=51811 RepID=A0ABY6JXV8_9ARAC|nr:RPL6 [Cordylochernes scorpioides]
METAKSAEKKIKSPAKSAAAKVEAKKDGKNKKPHHPRNKKLPGGIWKYSKSQMYGRRALYKIKKVAMEKKKDNEKPLYKVKQVNAKGGLQVRNVPIKKEQRVICLKHLKESGLLLVTGPWKANRVPLRRIHPGLVIATQTKLDLSEVKLPAHLNDRYFKRVKGSHKKKNKEEGSLFEAKPQAYVVSEQRKADQVEVDKQMMAAINKHPEKETLIHYLRARFSLRNGMYPHKMIY